MKNILLLSLLLITAQLFAQTSTIKGVVKDDLTGKPVIAATVSIPGTNFTAATDVSGNYVIANVPYGKYTLEIKDDTHGLYTQQLEITSPETAVNQVAMQMPQEELKKEEEAERQLEENSSTSTLTETDLQDIGNQSAMYAGAQRDLFSSTAAFTFGRASFKSRGYGGDFESVYLNGVPLNDLASGSTPSIGGLYSIMRQRTGIMGLSPSENSFGDVGGSYTFDNRASAQRKGLRVSYSVADRNFRNRILASYSTGILKGGWAITASFIRRWAQQGYVQGTFYDGYSYYFAIDKKFGTNNTLSLSTYGNPTKNGRAVATTMEAYNLAGSNYYNPGWGYQNGQMRNANISNVFRPSFTLNDEWKINDKSKLMLAAGFSFGKRKSSALDWNNAQDPLPDYYRNMPSYTRDTLLKAYAEQQFKNDVNVRQINWDNIYNMNRNSYDSIVNVDGKGQNMRINDSHYIIGNSVTAQKSFNFNTTYNADFTTHVSLSAGLTYQFEQVESYKEVADLLGGQYYLDVNQYAQLTYPGNDSVVQNNLTTPNHLVKVGDKYSYDYSTTTHHGNIWVQPEFHYKKLSFFFAGQLSTTAFWRNGLFLNGLFPTSSLGPSSTQTFLDYAFKGGLNYKFDKRNYIFINAGYFTKAPSINDVLTSPDTRNQIVSGLKSEQIYTAEAGYRYRSAMINATATFYFTQQNNQTQTLRFYDDDLYTNVNYTLTGINTMRIGGEGAIEVKIYKGFSATAVASVGRYIYTSRPSATITEDNSATVVGSNETVYWKGYSLPNMPQLATAFGLSYRSPQFWNVSANINYYDWMWISVNPAQRSNDAIVNVVPNSTTWNSILDQKRLNGQFVMNFSAGYSWLLNNDFKSINRKHRYYLAFNLSATNITNNTDFITNGREQLRFDFRAKNPNTYPPKYTYMYGATYMFTVAFRMN